MWMEYFVIYVFVHRIRTMCLELFLIIDISFRLKLKLV